MSKRSSAWADGAGRKVSAAAGAGRRRNGATGMVHETALLLTSSRVARRATAHAAPDLSRSATTIDRGRYAGSKREHRAASELR